MSLVGLMMAAFGTGSCSRCCSCSCRWSVCCRQAAAQLVALRDGDHLRSRRRDHPERRPVSMLALAIPMWSSTGVGRDRLARRPSKAKRGDSGGRARLTATIAALVDVRGDRPSTARYDFPLDPFQLRALDALDAGQSVLVAAPTGSGKTVVAEYAIAPALADGRRAFYTAPIKALSNQKYRDLAAGYGADQRRAAHRRQRDQRRCAGRRDDHRGAAQHDLRARRARSTTRPSSCSTRCTSCRTPTAVRCGRR